MVGATGKYASLVVPELRQQGVMVRALVRNESKLDAARQQGAEEVAIADLRDPDTNNFRPFSRTNSDFFYCMKGENGMIYF
jgi:putative NADH-flavin reductase